MKSVTACVRACVCMGGDKRDPAGLKLYPRARSFINGRILMTLACEDARVCVCPRERRRLLQSMCVGGKTSMCSQPLHTAEQIGEVVRSHNMWGQPGDEEVCRAGWR